MSAYRGDGADAQPHIHDGTSQNERLPAALDPPSFGIDETTLAQRIATTTDLAKALKFVDTNGADSTQFLRESPLVAGPGAFTRVVSIEGPGSLKLQLRYPLAGTENLALLRGQWVEVDRARLQRTMEQFQAAEELAARDGHEKVDAHGLDADLIDELGVGEVARAHAPRWRAKALERTQPHRQRTTHSGVTECSTALSAAITHIPPLPLGVPCFRPASPY